MHYTLRQLEIFLATAHFENITRAAASLSMSQSAASSALRELEQQFDLQLFDRIAKRLQLNERGRLLRPQAEALLAHAREFEASLGQDLGGGQLKVGATLSIGNYLAVGIMARYMAQYDHAKVSLEVANTHTIAAKVANFELDIGLIEGDIQHPQLNILPWRDDELAIFCAPNHPLAELPYLTETDIVEATWILREQGSGTRQTFDRAMGSLLPKLTISLELQHNEAIKQAVEAGLGLGCLSHLTLARAFEWGSLVPLRVRGLNLRRGFYFVLHRQKYHSTSIENWLALCRAGIS